MTAENNEPTTFGEGFQQALELMGMLFHALLALCAIAAFLFFAGWAVIALVTWSTLWGPLIVIGILSVPGAGIAGGILAVRRGRQRTDSSTPIQKDAKTPSMSMWKWTSECR